jgi:hypothetical protein
MAYFYDPSTIENENEITHAQSLRRSNARRKGENQPSSRGACIRSSQSSICRLRRSSER